MPGEALKATQKQLYKQVSQLLTCLTVLIDPELLSGEKALKACLAYRSIVETFGLPDMSDGLLMEIYLRMGKHAQAVACFV